MEDNDRVKILVVDDLGENLLAMETILSGPGREVVTVDSGQAALRRLLEEDFAVILLDVNMPGMDGFETATLIRQRPRSQHTPIIFLTAHGDETHASQGYSLGAVDYILTPVVPEVLRTKVGVFVELLKKSEQIRRQAEHRVALAREQAARTVAEDTTRRQAFLAEASHLLSRPLDSPATLTELLRLIVPIWADLAAIVLLDGPDRNRLAEWAWVDPADGRLVRKSAVEDPKQTAIWDAILRVLASGSPEYLRRDGVRVGPRSSVPPGTLEAAGGSHDVRVVVVPLIVSDRTLGAIAMAMEHSSRAYDPADMALVADLAGRAAIAIENIRLYGEIQERDRRKDEFLAMLAHELRNPLAPIRNAVEILRLQPDRAPQVQMASDVIDRQSRQMVRLVDDLLDVSRITRGKIQMQRSRVELRPVLATAMETSTPLLEARHHQLTVSLPPNEVWLEADPSRLAQVIANLLNNAAKYTPEGGHVRLAVEAEQDNVVLRVRDTGVGIGPEMLPKLFQPFIQADVSLDRSQGGLGIGLTLVRGIVELHGGTVRAISEGGGRGSEFVVTLPAAAPPGAPGPKAEDHPPERAPAAQRILVVDDNVDAAETLTVLLRKTGHEVEVARDGPAALEAVRAFQPTTVLLDIGLPGMDGYEVARRMRAQPETRRIFLVALTGYGQEEDRIRCEHAGFDLHLTKPIGADALQDLFVHRSPS